MQIMDYDEPNLPEMENPIIDETNTTTDNTQKDKNLDGLLKDIKSFKEFRDSVESKFQSYGASNNCQQERTKGFSAF